MIKLFDETSQALAVLQDARHSHFNCDMNDPFIAPAMHYVRVALSKDFCQAAKILAAMYSAQGNKAAFDRYRKKNEWGSKANRSQTAIQYLNDAFVDNQYSPQLYLQPADDWCAFTEEEFLHYVGMMSSIQKYFMTARTLDNLDHAARISRGFFEEINQFVNKYALPDDKQPKKQDGTQRRRNGKVYNYKRTPGSRPPG